MATSTEEAQVPPAPLPATVEKYLEHVRVERRLAERKADEARPAVAKSSDQADR